MGENIIILLILVVCSFLFLSFTFFFFPPLQPNSFVRKLRLLSFLQRNILTIYNSKIQPTKNKWKKCVYDDEKFNAQ
jgi:branched-subunit amino acid transport protein AzlD